MLKIMMAVATAVFKYRHRSSLACGIQIYHSLACEKTDLQSHTLGAFRFALFRLDRFSCRIIPRDRFERCYFQPVTA